MGLENVIFVDLATLWKNKFLKRMLLTSDLVAAGNRIRDSTGN